MIPTLIFIVILSSFLVYLSISDIKSHEISFIVTLAALIFSVVYIIGLNLLHLNDYLPDLGNALKGLFVAGGLSGLLVLLTKEKALGSGDIFLFSIMGISLGFSNLLFGFLLAIYSAVFYGIFLAIKKKKFHGLEVPLVPFISFGIIGGILLSPILASYLAQFTILSI